VNFYLIRLFDCGYTDILMSVQLEATHERIYDTIWCSVHFKIHYYG